MGFHWRPTLLRAPFEMKRRTIGNHRVQEFVHDREPRSFCRAALAAPPARSGRRPMPAEGPGAQRSRSRGRAATAGPHQNDFNPRNGCLLLGDPPKRLCFALWFPFKPSPKSVPSKTNTHTHTNTQIHKYTKTPTHQHRNTQTHTKCSTGRGVWTTCG